MDGYKIYAIDAKKDFPRSTSRKNIKTKHERKMYDSTRIELVQDLSFPASCQRLKLSADRNYLIASGLHGPRIRCYDLSQLSLKFERFLDSEVVDFQIVSDDYSKIVLLSSDQSISVLTKSGSTLRVRLPWQGRDIAYLPFTTDIVVVGSASEIYRLSLSEGKFLTPLQSHASAINVCGYSPYHGLFGCAGENGILECFDLRASRSLGYVDVSSPSATHKDHLTSIRFDDDGVHLAVGTSSGKVIIYDLRSSNPFLIKKLTDGLPVIDIKYQRNPELETHQMMITSDSSHVKIWGKNDGRTLASLQISQKSDGGINDLCLWPYSGLLLLALDMPHLKPYFIPQLGPAPKWCSFLECFTEQLEEASSEPHYKDFRFLTRKDITNLGLTRLLGTSLLKAYMHGFFIDNRLYKKAKSLSDPYKHDTVGNHGSETRNKRYNDHGRYSHTEEKQPSQNKYSVYPAQLEQTLKLGMRKNLYSTTVFEDYRFNNIFVSSDFNVDENSDEFKNFDTHISKTINKKLEEYFAELQT